jgi:hypothetical protein
VLAGMGRRRDGPGRVGRCRAGRPARAAGRGTDKAGGAGGRCALWVRARPGQSWGGRRVGSRQRARIRAGKNKKTGGLHKSGRET